MQSMNTLCYSVAVLSWIGLIVYPFAKRVTDFSQVVLGIQIGTAKWMGMAAMDKDALRHDMYDRRALAAFYVANVAWTLVYGFVYAQMDLGDDIQAGVWSMACAFRISRKYSCVGL